MDLREIFKKNMRARRQQLGLSQEALANKYNVDRTFIGHLERGTRYPTLHTVQQIAKGLEIDPAILQLSDYSELDDGIYLLQNGKNPEIVKIDRRNVSKKIRNYLDCKD